MSNDFDLDVPSFEEETPKTAPQIISQQSDAIDLPDVDFGERSSDPSYVVEPDAKELAIKFGVIGGGQGGGRLADTFYQVGYRRVCAINTTAQDFMGLVMPEKNRLVLEESGGGAGKDPSKGEQALKASTEEVKKAYLEFKQLLKTD